MICYLSDRCKKFDCNVCDENFFCIKKFKINKLFDLAMISEQQRKNMKFYTEQCDEKSYCELNNISNNARENIENGLNIYLFSENTGTGKTSWALRVAQRYISQIWYDSDISPRVLYISVPRYLLAIKDAISNTNEYVDHIKQNVLNADLVIWDDIATKNSTEFEAENLLSIINTRLDLGKSNIYTTNISPNDLQNMLGARLTSRIVGKSKVIQFFGKDKRNL